MTTTITFGAPLRLFRSATNGSAAAYVTLPTETAKAVVAAAMAGQWLTQGRKGNFGSAKVMATIGATTWANAIYPDKLSDSWAMPVKKAVCQAEGLQEGDRVTVVIAL